MRPLPVHCLSSTARTLAPCCAHRPRRFQPAAESQTIRAWLPPICDPLRGVIKPERGHVFRPLPANMFNEFCIPGAMHHATLPPVENELRDGILDETVADANVTQNLQRVRTRQPLRRHGARQLSRAFTRLLMTPLFQHVLIERIAPGKPRLASVTPIVHKLRNQAANEVLRDGMLSGQPNPVFFRLPIIRDRLGRIRAGTLTLTDRQRGFNPWHISSLWRQWLCLRNRFATVINGNPDRLRIHDMLQFQHAEVLQALPISQTLLYTPEREQPGSSRSSRQSQRKPESLWRCWPRWRMSSAST